MENRSSHSVLKSSDSYKKSSHSANFDIGRLWSRRPMENRSSHSVLKSTHSVSKSTDSYKETSHSAKFDIGRIWSRRPMENRSSHSVSKSSHLVIAKISKKKFLLEFAELSNLGLKKIFYKNFFYRTQSNFVMGCPWSRRPMKNPASHSVSKSSHSVSKSTDSYKKPRTQPISILAVYGVEGQWKIDPRTQF